MGFPGQSMNINRLKCLIYKALMQKQQQLKPHGALSQLSAIRNIEKKFLTWNTWRNKTDMKHFLTTGFFQFVINCTVFLKLMVVIEVY